MPPVIFFSYIDPGTGFTLANIGAWVFAAGAGIVGFFFRKPRNILIALFCIIVSIFLVFSLLKQTGRSPLQKKVVLLGFDGLSPVLTESLMAEGRLPNFSRLKSMGVYSPLGTANPPQSPVAWSVFSTGLNPGKNGIYDFIARDPRDYKLRLSMSDTEGGHPKKVVRAKRFWEYTSKKNVPTVVLSCPVTLPPDRVNGKMLSGMGIPDVLGTEGTFSFYTSEPLDKTKDIGGNVYPVKVSPVMALELTGPRVASLSGKPKNVTTPFKVVPEKNSVRITCQGKEIRLETGHWSDWQEVSFRIGFFKKMKGIFKFHLVETSPQFKLYVSPINFDPREPYFPISYPEDYSKELAERLGLFYTLGMPMETWAVNEKRLDEKAFLEQARTVSDDRRRQLNYELDRMKNGVLFCYFEDPDIIQHMFWRYTDPKHPLYEPDAPDEYKEMIRSWYVRMDGIVGEVLKKLGPEDVLLVFSDHGFDTFERTVHLNSWLKENGYLALKSGASGELLQNVDWTRTKAYAIGFGAVYLNLKGRERDGIVAPGEEANKLKEAIASGFRQWKDTKDGATVVNNVYRQEDIFRGPYAAETPDLYVGFNKGYQASWQTALGGTPDGLIEDNLKKWSGTHLFDPALIPGVFFGNIKIDRADPTLYDLAPTILKLSGYSDEEIKKLELDGRSLV